MFKFGAGREMNTYLYAPKDDPYHRVQWRVPYPEAQWRELVSLIGLARKSEIDFVYGFHPGKGLCFSEREAIDALLAKARSFYKAGVRSFAVLFDDIPSALEHSRDRREFRGLAKAEAVWLKRILESQPKSWRGVEWWICPSRYSEDPLLEKMFGAFEPDFWETFGTELPEAVLCLWTGPKVVSKEITLEDAARARECLRHRLILWDNYPVNDLSMSGEMHLAPLTGRDPRLPQEVAGYLTNPLLQEALSLIPLATCFDYAADPFHYDPETSWVRAIREIFSDAALPHWRALREFCDRVSHTKDKDPPLLLSSEQRLALMEARRYVLENRAEQWFVEFQPWFTVLEEILNTTGRKIG